MKLGSFRTKSSPFMIWQYTYFYDQNHTDRFWRNEFLSQCRPHLGLGSDDLTHWGLVIIIGSDNGLSHGRRQAIIWTNAGILLIGPLLTIFSEISIGIQTFSFKKMHLKMSSAKWPPSCLGLNVLRNGTGKKLDNFCGTTKCFLQSQFKDSQQTHKFSWVHLRLSILIRDKRPH